MMNWETSKPLETQLIPGWAKQAGFQKCFVYRGNSMLPTFQPGQLLYIREIIESIGTGDVIVFNKPDHGDFTVHRVIKQMEFGWLTRGDNNSRMDVFPIFQDQIVGRVERIEFRNRIIAVRGGKYGLWKARIRWGLRDLKSRTPRFVKAMHHKIRLSEMVYRFLNQYLGKHLKTIRINIPAGSLIKISYKGKIVARWFEGQKEIYCQKPFDLIINREDKDIVK
jgi:signal peptidase I